MRSKTRRKAGALGVILAVAVGGAAAIASGITHMPEQQQSDTQATHISTVPVQNAATSPDLQNLEEILYTAECVETISTSQYAKILVSRAGKPVTSVTFVKDVEPGSRLVFNGGIVDLTRHYFDCLDGVVDKNNRVYGLAAYGGNKGPSLVRSFGFDGKPVSDYWTKESISGIAIAYGVIPDGNNYIVSIGQTIDGKPVVHLLKTDGLELAATYIPKGKQGSHYDLQVISDLQVTPVEGTKDSLIQFRLRSQFELMSRKPGEPYIILASEVLTKYAVTPAK